MAAKNSLALKLRSRPEETGWGGKKTHDTVDGRNPANQLRLVVYPIIHRVGMYTLVVWISAMNSITMKSKKFPQQKSQKKTKNILDCISDDFTFVVFVEPQSQQKTCGIFIEQVGFMSLKGLSIEKWKGFFHNPEVKVNN